MFDACGHERNVKACNLTLTLIRSPDRPQKLVLTLTLTLTLTLHRVRFQDPRPNPYFQNSPNLNPYDKWSLIAALT